MRHRGEPIRDLQHVIPRPIIIAYSTIALNPVRDAALLSITRGLVTRVAPPDGTR